MGHPVGHLSASLHFEQVGGAERQQLLLQPTGKLRLLAFARCRTEQVADIVLFRDDPDDLYRRLVLSTLAFFFVLRAFCLSSDLVLGHR